MRIKCQLKKFSNLSPQIHVLIEETTMGWTCTKTPSQPYILESHKIWVYLQLTSVEIQLKMGGKCKRMCCQTSPVSYLDADHTEQNRFEAEIMGGQGLTIGCSAIGWMDTSIVSLFLWRTASVRLCSWLFAMQIMGSVKEEVLIKYLGIRERK